MTKSRALLLLAPLASLSLLSSTAACRTSPSTTSGAASTATEPPLPPGETRVVQPGDTLREIASDAGLDVDELAEVNGLDNADDITAGMVLFIPASAAKTPTTTEPTPEPTPEPTTDKQPTATTTALSWPVEGLVLRDFSQTRAKKPGYDGILIAAPPGSAVKAAAGGVVAFAGSQGTNTGVFVVVDHPGDLVTVYAHLLSARVKEGQTVAQGDVVGEIGATGLSGVSPRLQFQVRRKQAPIDPLPLLPP